MKLVTKISFGMGTLGLLMAVLAGYLLWQMAELNSITSVLAHRNVPVSELAGEVSADVAEYRILEFRYLSEKDPQKMASLASAAEDVRRKFDREVKELGELCISGNARQCVVGIEHELKSYLDTSREVYRLRQEGKPAESFELLTGKGQADYGTLAAAIDRLVKTSHDNANARGLLGDNLYAKSNALGICLTIFALLLAAGVAVLIARETKRQLGKDPGDLLLTAQRVVDGDFNIDDGHAKIGVYGAITSMVEALKGHIDEARRESENAREQTRQAHAAMDSANAAKDEAHKKAEAMLSAAERLERVAQVVSSASTQLSAQIEQSDKGASQAAQRLAETATAMNQMNATVQEVARNAGQASVASSETKEKAESGSAIVQKSLLSIGQVQTVSQELKQDMLQLNTHAQAISQIMGVISDIADQTNLLALNAAIEAARAGDAGRGFAVVADEVRKLAEKTMASTHDVGNAISAIQTSTAKSMDSMDNALEQVNQATGYASQSGQALNEILETVLGMADQVNAIATASEEQSAASEEINQTIVHVNDMVKQTADAMGEATHAVVELASQAQDLGMLIKEMKQE